MHSPAKGFQTRGSSLIITVFWYKGYSSINSSLSVSVTKCRTAKIDACAYVYYCIFKETKCNTYLKLITRHTMLRFSRGRNEKTSSVLHFSLPHNSCVFLNLMTPHHQSIFHHCEITFATMPGGSDIDHTDGFIRRPNLVEVLGKKDCSTSEDLTCKRLSHGRNVVNIAKEP